MLKRKRAADEAAAPAAAASSASSEPKSKLQRKEESRDVSRYVNKQRTLVLSSRGITHRDRHLLSDLRDLLPHSKKDVKFDAKDDLATINELCEMKNCNNCIFFEARKRKDLYMWVSKAPNGPSAKFQVQNSQSRGHTPWPYEERAGKARSMMDANGCAFHPHNFAAQFQSGGTAGRQSRVAWLQLSSRDLPLTVAPLVFVMFPLVLQSTRWPR